MDLPASMSMERDNKINLWSRDELSTIKRLCAETATEEEFKLFIYQAQKTGLDPLRRQIYFTKYLNKKTGKHTASIITSIDGYRLIADRTGQYAGSDDSIIEEDESKTKIIKATVTVWKMVNNTRCPFTASARWSEYCPAISSKAFMWEKMPYFMISKCAESLALRKAFPSELSGMYTEDEMDQAHQDPVTFNKDRAPDKENKPRAHEVHANPLPDWESSGSKTKCSQKQADFLYTLAINQMKWHVFDFTLFLQSRGYTHKEDVPFDRVNGLIDEIKNIGPKPLEGAALDWKAKLANKKENTNEI